MRAAIVIALIARTAVAAPAAEPWAEGVSKSAQDAATALNEEGNDLFARQAHAPALEKYRAAVAIWDHPSIRFNLAVTLIRLDRILEAADELDRALRYGEKPFSTSERYHEALDYQSLVAGRLVFVEAHCDRAGPHVLFDGKPWFDCPGTQRVRVLAGQHLLVAQRPDYLTLSKPLVLVGGTEAHETIELAPLDHDVAMRYPRPRWLPWTIAGGGTALALGGVALWLVGDNKLNTFDSEWTAACPSGCKLGEQPYLEAHRSTALLDKDVGLSMMITGTAVAIGGAVFVILNRPVRVVPHIEVLPKGGLRVGVTWRR